MPTYEYECKECEHKFEVFQSMKGDPIKECPECKGEVRRLFGTGGGIIFKGSGFYATDYRSEEYKRRAQEEKKNSQESTSNKKDSKKESSEDN